MQNSESAAKFFAPNGLKNRFPRSGWGMDNFCMTFSATMIPLSTPEPIVIDVLWGKVATKVGTFLAKSMNLVHTFPDGPQIVKL